MRRRSMWLLTAGEEEEEKEEEGRVEEEEERLGMVWGVSSEMLWCRKDTSGCSSKKH